MLHGYSYVRLGQLGTWWVNTRNLIVGIVDNDLGPGMGRLSGGLGSLVTAADGMATGVGGAFGRMATAVVDELTRALGARDRFVGGLGVSGVGGLATAGDAGTVVRISSPVSSAMTQMWDGGWRDDPKIFSSDLGRQQWLGDRFSEGWPSPTFEAPPGYADSVDIDAGGDGFTMGVGIRVGGIGLCLTRVGREVLVILVRDFSRMRSLLTCRCLTRDCRLITSTGWICLLFLII